MKTKEALHELIDRIENEKALKGYFELILRLNNNQTGQLWDSLNSEEREELKLSYEESLDSKNLLGHDDVKGQHSKWLRK